MAEIKNFPLDKYKFYVTKNKVIAVSTYAGKTVRGVAICADSDTFDLEKGKQLAAARCNAKVAAKRLANAEAYYNELAQMLSEINNEFNSVCTYYKDSYERFMNANAEVAKLTESF